MKNMKLFITLYLSLYLLGITVQSHAALKDPLTTIDIETPVHFPSPDGSDLRVEAGTYAIEPAEEWIRLISGERHDALLIEAQKATHEMELEHAIAMSVPGESEDQLDHHYVMLLLPGGQSLEATGTYSGIRPRGFFHKAFNKIKRRAKQAYKKSRSLSKKGGDQLTKDFLNLNIQDPNNAPSTHSQLHNQASKMRKRAMDLTRKQATRSQVHRQAAKARKHLHDIKRKIETNARQAWRKARQMYGNAKKRASSAISVTKTPTPGGPVPIPYPNISNPKGTKRTGKSR